MGIWNYYFNNNYNPNGHMELLFYYLINIELLFYYLINMELLFYYF